MKRINLALFLSFVKRINYTISLKHKQNPSILCMWILKGMCAKTFNHTIFGSKKSTHISWYPWSYVLSGILISWYESLHYTTAKVIYTDDHKHYLQANYWCTLNLVIVLNVNIWGLGTWFLGEHHKLFLLCQIFWTCNTRSSGDSTSCLYTLQYITSGLVQF